MFVCCCTCFCSSFASFYIERLITGRHFNAHFILYLSLPSYKYTQHAMRFKKLLKYLCSEINTKKSVGRQLDVHSVLHQCLCRLLLRKAHAHQHRHVLI